MEKDNIYTEEQEKELIERINEIKNQTKKENNNNVQINEQPIENNNTAGIENVIVYQDNAKKTMKGKKTKLIASIVAGVMLISGVGTAIAIKKAQPNEIELYIQKIENLLVEDETHVIVPVQEGTHYGFIKIAVNPSDYNNSDFETPDLYYNLYEEKVKNACKDGYNPADADDVFCIYDYIPLDSKMEETYFDKTYGQPYYPKNGYYFYAVKNNVDVWLLAEVDYNNVPVEDYDRYNLGLSTHPLETSSLNTVQK